MTQVLLADDHAFFRAGLKAALETAGHEVVASVGDGVTGLAAIKKLDPDLVILDLRMPNCDGLETIATMRRAGDQRPVIVLATEVDDKALAGLAKAGANAILYKFGSESRLFEAIRAVMAGARMFDGDIFDRMLGVSKMTPAVDQHHLLSDREQLIAGEIAKGISNREIATRLDITEGTVKVHLHNIYSKLGVRNRTELALAFNGRPVG